MELICLQIDLARQKESIDYVKSYIDIAKRNGYNALLVYLENAIRTEDTFFFEETQTYSAQEICEIVEYAEQQGIDVIPAFENLGHLEKFMAYPQFSDISECENEAIDGRGLSPFKLGTCGCTRKSQLYEKLDKYITDVCRLFHSQYVHMGLDEPFDFAVCKKCRGELEKGVTKSDMFLEHVLHSYDLVKKMGKTMLMWDDFFEYANIAEKLPRDIIFCNWNYYFVADEPGGHWINRKKRDWFAYYEKLGFRYMFCAYANGGSCTYNVDTFTAYARKYRPFGAVLTSWEKSNAFYLGTYPLIAYTGRKWNGKIQTEKDRLDAYRSVVQDEECARLLLSLQAPAFYGGYTDVAKVCENDYLVKSIFRNTVEYALPQLKKYIKRAKGEAKYVLTDIYDYYLEFALDLRLERLGTDVFDHYETRCFCERYFEESFNKLLYAYDELEKNAVALWKKYRKGIISCDGAFEKKYQMKKQHIANLKKELFLHKEAGVLYLDLMLHDGFGTPRTVVWVKYKGDSVETLLYAGRIKPSATGFELGGCYTLRIRTEARQIDWMIFEIYGEGAIYPLHFRYSMLGKKRNVCKAESLQGNIVCVEKVLYNDTRFAQMGYDDGDKHFNDISVSKQKHRMKIFFEE